MKMSKKITNSITQGVYVLTTIDAGCVVDAVSQVSFGDFPLISVAVNKQNYTNPKIKQHQKFALSILSEMVDPKIIETFGMHSSRDYDKFGQVKATVVDDIAIIDEAIGYLYCEVVEQIDADTHTLFIGKMVKSKRFTEDVPMSYLFYQQNKDKLLASIAPKEQKAFVCTVCGYTYYGDELPKDYTCPLCGVSREFFKPKN